MTEKDSGPRVVVADADPWARELLVELLRSVRGDARVIACADGQSALEACRAQRPALVLADRGLPGNPDGLGLLRALRRQRDEPPLPFIMLSERTDAASVREALPLAPTAYLARPLNLELLRKRLVDLLLAPGQEAVPARSERTEGQTLDDFLRHLRERSTGAPLLEEVHGALSNRLNAAELDIETLRENFSRDPQITARLIAVANSAAQHVGRPCQTLSQAIARVGVVRTLNLVLGLTLQRSASLVDEDLAGRASGFWGQSQYCADLAAVLAGLLRADVERCYCAGLLHCLGDLALLRCLQEWRLAGGELGEQDIEVSLQRHAAGFGSALRARWRLPLELRELVAATWQLGGGVFSREVLIMHLAAHLARLPEGQGVETLLENKAAQMLKLDAKRLELVRLRAMGRLGEELSKGAAT